MKGKPKPIYKGIELDSTEEVEFYMWLEEAHEAKIIDAFGYKPDRFLLIEGANHFVEKQLKTKTNIVERQLLKPHTYQPDFVFCPYEIFWTKFNTSLIKFEDKPDIYCDIKGTFNRGQFDSDFTFRINQKLMYAKFKIYVNKVVLKPMKVGKTIREGFFKQTWVPTGCAWMKNRIEPTRRKSYEDCKLLSEITL